MSDTRDVCIVAQWEFGRFFKWKDQLISLALFLLVSGVWAGAALVAGSRGSTVTIAISGIDLQPPAGGRFRFVPAAPDNAPMHTSRVSLMTASPRSAPRHRARRE
jgi:hypothetical protein